MGYIATNAVAILAATLAGLLVGALYRAVPGGRSGGSGAGRPGLSAGFLVTAAVAEAWLAAILAGALILAPSAGPGPWVMALATAIVIWAGFVLPTTVVADRHAGASAGATVGHCLHWLAVMLAQAATLQAIGLVKPA